MTTCRNCPAEIFVARAPGGVNLPIEAQEAADGTVAVTFKRGELPQARLLDQGQKPALGEALFHSHLTRCPAAQKYRRAGARRHRR